MTGVVSVRAISHALKVSCRLFAGSRVVNEYRLYAAECLCIADDITDAQNKTLLVAMAQAWLRLAQQTRGRVASPA